MSGGVGGEVANAAPAREYGAEELRHVAAGDDEWAAEKAAPAVWGQSVYFFRIWRNLPLGEGGYKSTIRHAWQIDQVRRIGETWRTGGDRPGASVHGNDSGVL